MAGDLKVQKSLSLKGPFVGYRSTSSNSAKDGTTFVSVRTEQGDALRKAFKGQTSASSRLLTNTPDGPQVLRAHQTGLLNLASFERVAGREPRVQERLEPPGHDLQIDDRQEDMPILLGLDFDGEVPDVGEPGEGPLLLDLDDLPRSIGQRLDDARDEIRQLEDDFDAWNDARQARGGSKSDRRRAEIFERDRLNGAVAGILKSLRDLAADDIGHGMTEEIRAAGREAMTVALKLHMPGLAVPGAHEPGLEDLSAAMLELEDRLIRASGGQDTGHSLDKLISLIASRSRIRERSGEPLESSRVMAVEEMTVFVETILDAVGPGRDGVELNSLMGQSGELDGMLKLLRLAAARELFERDLARLNDCAVEDLPQDLRAQAGNLAREVVTRDAEIALARQQVRRTMENAGIRDVTLAGLSGLRVDSSLIRGLRETYPRSAQAIGLIVARLEYLEQGALGSEAAVSLRAALERERDHLAQQADAWKDDNRDLMIEIDAVSETIRALGRQIDAGGDDVAEVEQRYEDACGLRDRLRGQRAPLTAMERQIAQLSQRIGSLTPEEELLRGRHAAAQAGVLEIETRLDGRLQARAVLEQTLAALGEGQAFEDCSARLLQVNADIQALTEQLRIARRAEATAKTSYDAVSTEALRGFEQALLDAEAERAQAFEQVVGLLQAYTAVLDTIAAMERGAENPHRDGDLAGLSLAELRQRGDEIGAQLEQRDRDLVGAQDRLAGAERDLAGERARLARSIALTGGLTPAELELLGLTDAEAEDILGIVDGLARQGLSTAEQAAAICRDINRLTGALGNDLFGTTTTAARNQISVMEARNNDVLARRLGERLMRSLTGDADATLLGVSSEEMQRALNGGEDLPGRLGDLRGLIGEGALQNEWEQSRQTYDRLEQRFVDLAGEHRRLPEWHQWAVERVEAFPGRRIDARRPQGLAVSTTLRIAVNLARKEDRTPAEEAELRDCRKSLRGFNPDRLEVPFIQMGKPLPGIDRILEWGEDAELMSTADAIIFLREYEPDIPGRISACTTGIDGIVERRLEMMGESGRALRDTVRAAILQNFARSGVTLTEFRPAEHAEEIKAALRDWGVPVDDVLPEINLMLSESFGPDELNLWDRTTTVSEEYVADRQRMEQERGEELAGRSQVARVRPEVAGELLDAVDDLQPGTKVKLFAGTRVEVQTGRIPITPFMGASGRFAVGKIDGLEIQRSSMDGYELIIRDGWDGRAGGTFGVGPKEGGLRVELAADAQGAYAGVTGVAMRFRDAEGLKAVLGRLLGKAQITAQDLAEAENILPVFEWRLGGSVHAGLHARFRGVDQQGFSFDVPGTDVGVSPLSAEARATGGISAAMKTFTAESANMTVRNTNRDFAWEFVAAGSVTLLPIRVLPNLPVLSSVEGQTWEKPETGLLGVAEQVTYSVFSRTKTKQTRGPDGLVTRSTERHEQMTMQNRWPDTVESRRALVERLGGDAYRRLMEKLPEQQRDEADRLIMMAGSADMLNVSFTLDERVRGAVNELLLQAKALRAGSGVGLTMTEAVRQAEALEKQAQAMLDDADNYNPSKLQLIPTRQNMQGLNFADFYFVRAERYVEDRSEWVAAKMDFDPGLAQQVRDEITRDAA